MSKHTPGPWRVGYRALHVFADNAKIGGDAMVCEIRGWGYLTGNGHGALGLDPKEAAEIQDANARLIAAAPDLLEALRYVETRCVSEAAYPHASIEDRKMRDMVVAAIANAEGRS